MSVQAVAKSVNMSPRKVGVVADLVRGRSVEDALVILDHTPRRSADVVKRVIKSAQANAQHNHNLKPGTMKITEITVTHGPRTKRWKPVARGSAHPYQKRSSHIKVVVDGEVRVVKKKSEAKEKETK
jgi:large subunit ribosomal protein L22